MDIRTKLVFALVSVAVGSMLAFGAFTYRAVEDDVTELRLNQLEGMARFQADAVGRIVVGWYDRVGLIAGRAALAESLDRYLTSHEPGGERAIDRVLLNAIGASTIIRELRVLDQQGEEVRRITRPGSSPLGTTPLPAIAPTSGVEYAGVRFEGESAPTVRLVAPIRLAGRSVGSLHAFLSTEEISALSARYEGLGDSGETLVILPDEGVLRTLHPVRFPTDGGRSPGQLVAWDGVAAEVTEAERVPRILTDYRGEEVWASAGDVPETPWTVVVKIDAAEQGAPLAEVRRDMISVAITLAAFAILFGFLLGFRFAQPIHLLAETAKHLGVGDLTARTDIGHREDEVGLLAKTFDEMADALESQVELLSEFRRFFDVSLDMLCIASTDGYFKRVNPAFVRELGWPEEELLSRPFLSFVHPDDVGATEEEVMKLAEGRPTIRFTNRFLCMDGSFKRLRWNSYSDPHTGRLYAIARVRSPAQEDDL